MQAGGHNALTAASGKKARDAGMQDDRAEREQLAAVHSVCPTGGLHLHPSGADCEAFRRRAARVPAPSVVFSVGRRQKRACEFLQDSSLALLFLSAWDRARGE